MVSKSRGRNNPLTWFVKGGGGAQQVGPKSRRSEKAPKLSMWEGWVDGEEYGGIRG